MDRPKSTMAQQVAQAAIAFEQRQTDNQVSKSVTVRSQRTIGERIARATRAFEKRRTKHGRKWVAVFMNVDTIVIALHGSLTDAEKALAQSPAGAARVREFHRQMFTDAPAVLHRKIKSITGMEVRDTTAEIEPKTGHVVQIFTTDTVGTPAKTEAEIAASPSRPRGFLDISRCSLTATLPPLPTRARPFPWQATPALVQ